MKKILCLALGLLLAVAVCGCRRRITPEADRIVRETYLESQPDPNLPGDETLPGGEPEETGEPDRVPDDTAPPVEETTPAEGGEKTPDAPEPPEKGEPLTVTLDPNGGECGRQTMTVHAGAVYGDLPQPVYPGHTFKGWFSQPSGGFSVDSTTVVTIRRDHTLYAQWSEFIGYTLTFDPNGGRLSPYRTQKQAFPGDPYGEMPIPTRKGYVFSGWFSDPEAGREVKQSDPFTAAKDQTLYAHWAYDPYAYWTFVLENTTQKIYSCQQTWIYLELEAKGVTQIESPLIDPTGSQNIAQNLTDTHVSDDWVKGKRPDVIVKITGDMGTAEGVQTAVEERFPGKRVYVFPAQAVSGSEAEQLYYRLALAKLVYPEWYRELDLNTVGAELEVAGQVHS